jgi:HPt (histidine-containing phosphotransfer) domain-containing protein
MDNRIPDELLKVYNQTIPEKLAKIKQLMEEVKIRPGQEELAALRFAIHKMAGNSGTYGYSEVCQLCMAAESRLNEILGKLPSTPPPPEWLNQLDQLYLDIEKGFKNRGSSKEV